MSGINIHIYPSPIVHESRMLKETEALGTTQLFDEIHLVGMQTGDLPASQQLDPKRKILRIASSGRQQGTLGRMLGFIQFMVRILQYYRGCNVSAVSCHCLAVLPLGVLFKLLRGSKLIYEAHELETERNGWSKSRRILSKVVERSLIRFVDYTVVVGYSIENWYRETYGIQTVCTVRNIPTTKSHGPKTPILRERFGIPENALLFIYQGVLNAGRGLELLIKAFSRLPHLHVVFLGFGPLEKEIQKASETWSNIHLHEALPPGKAGPYTSSADVGLALFENTSLSYYYSSPNKLFEYILSEIPVIASDFPDMAAVIDEFGCGWKADVSEESLFTLLRSLNKEAIDSATQGARKGSQHLDWSHESEVLVKAYHSVMCPSEAKHAVAA
jgi:glycosyltransferase involved in cell wall biosynthesis